MTREELLQALAAFFWDASPITGESQEAQTAIEKGLGVWPIGFESVEAIRDAFDKVLR